MDREGERGVRGGNGDRARVRCPQGGIGQGREWAGLAGHWLGRGPVGLGGFFSFFLLVCFSILFLFFFSVLLNFGVYEKPKLHLKYF